MSRVVALRRPQALIAFPTKLPILVLSTDGATQTSWIQIAVVGDVKSRKLAITQDNLRQMFANFSTGKFPEPPTKICVDYDHLSLDPPGAGDGKAAGWVTQLELREGDAELWALVEWTPTGAKAIADREYQFVSPVIAQQFQTNAGEQIGCTLFNVAITNVPQLQGMEPASLRRSNGKRVSVALAMGDRDRWDRVACAVHDEYGDPFDEWHDDCYLIDLFGDQAVFRKDGRLWQVAFAIAEGGAVTFSGEPQEVTLQPVALSRPATRTAPMSKITLKATNGQTIELDPAQLEDTELVKSLRARLPAEGQIVVAVAEHQALTAKVEALTANVTQLSADNEAHKKAIADRDATDAVTTLLRARKITPAQQEQYKTLFLKDRPLFDSLTSTLQPTALPALDHETGSGVDTSDAQTTLTAEAAKLRAANPALTAEQAFARACEMHPALAYQDTRAGR